MTLPKKILRIKDLTFILSDEFSGDLSDALKEFIDYKEQFKSNAKYIYPDERFTSIEILASTNSKVCGEYGLFELVDGTYKFIQGTAPSKDE